MTLLTIWFAGSLAIGVLWALAGWVFHEAAARPKARATLVLRLVHCEALIAETVGAGMP